MSYAVDGNRLVIIQCYGDGKYWDNMATELAIKNKVDKIMFITKRNPQAFERKYGYKVIGYAMERGV